MSRNAPSKGTAAHIRTTFLSRFEPITPAPWSSGNRKKEVKQRDDVEAALLATANSFVEQAKKTPEPQKAESECEYSYFCKSLLPRLKKLPPRTRAAVRMNIEQVLFEAEYPRLGRFNLVGASSNAVPYKVSDRTLASFVLPYAPISTNVKQYLASLTASKTILDNFS